MCTWEQTEEECDDEAESVDGQVPDCVLAVQLERGHRTLNSTTAIHIFFRSAASCVPTTFNTWTPVCKFSKLTWWIRWLGPKLDSKGSRQDQTRRPETIRKTTEHVQISASDRRDSAVF